MLVLPCELEVLCRSGLFRLAKGLGLSDWDLVTGPGKGEVGVCADDWNR